VHAQLLDLDGIGPPGTDQPSQSLLHHHGAGLIEHVIRREDRGMAARGPTRVGERSVNDAGSEAECRAIVAAGRRVTDPIWMIRIEEDHVIRIGQKLSAPDVLDEDSLPDERHAGGAGALLASASGMSRPATDVRDQNCSSSEESLASRRLRHAR
jgi:hypothetical protein